jgi:hypothetical protein
MEVNGIPVGEWKFEALVDYLAGQALMSIGRGEKWRSIVWDVANTIAFWSAENKR